MPHEPGDVKWPRHAGVNLWAMVRWRKTRPTHVSRYFSLQTFLFLSCSYQENGILIWFYIVQIFWAPDLVSFFIYGKLYFPKVDATNLELPSHLLYFTMLLMPLPLRGGVYVPFPQIWVGAGDCSSP